MLSNGRVANLQLGGKRAGVGRPIGFQKLNNAVDRAGARRGQLGFAPHAILKRKKALRCEFFREFYKKILS